MPTPMFKVLAQSLRLGQPPDATTAVRVLVEVIEKQQAELEDMRSKLSIATSRVQYAEARLTRLLEVVESVPLREDHLRDAAMPQQAQHAPPVPTADRRRSEAPRASQRPPVIPASPPIPKAPRAPSINPGGPVLHDLVEGESEMNQTLVISKRDVAQVGGGDAPFPIARASERPRAITRNEGTPFHVPGPPPPEEAHAEDEPFQPPAEPREVPRHQQQQQLRRSMVSDPETNAMDLEVAQGDMTVTEQTARVALAGLAELEARARRGPGRRDPEE